MSTEEIRYRPTFTVLGGYIGFFVVGAAAIAFVYSAGDPGSRAHWLRVVIAAVIGAGVGAYLGATRREFIVSCAAPLVRPLSALGRAFCQDRDRLRLAIRWLIAMPVVAAWAFFIARPDWQLCRIIARLQCSDLETSGAAVRELGDWRDGGITALVHERNQMLADLLNHKEANVRAAAVNAFAECEPDIPASQVTPALLKICRDADSEARRTAAYALGQIDADPAPTVPVLIELLEDSELSVRREAVFALHGFGVAAQDAVPRLAKLVVDPDDWMKTWAIHTLGSIHSNAAVSVPALSRVFESPNLEMRGLASEALAAFGPEAAAAVPALENELNCGVYWRAKNASNAIREINPERFAELVAAARRAESESPPEYPAIND